MKRFFCGSIYLTVLMGGASLPAVAFPGKTAQLRCSSKGINIDAETYFANFSSGFSPVTIDELKAIHASLLARFPDGRFPAREVSKALEPFFDRRDRLRLLAEFMAYFRHIPEASGETVNWSTQFETFFQRWLPYVENMRTAQFSDEEICFLHSKVKLLQKLKDRSGIGTTVRRAGDQKLTLLDADSVLDVTLGIRAYNQWKKEAVSSQVHTQAEKNSGTWIGQAPDILNTPYRVFMEVLSELHLPAGAVVVDMGAGHGRMGMVIGILNPELHYVGIEYHASRIADASRTARNLGLSRVKYQQADFTDPKFNAPDGDVFFFYRPNEKEEYNRIAISKLESIAKKKKILVLSIFLNNPKSSFEGFPWLKFRGRLNTSVKGRPIEVFESQ